MEPTQTEVFCVNTRLVYDWIQDRVELPTITLKRGLVYMVTFIEGDCGDLVTGDLVCLPFELPAEEELFCESDTCTLLLERVIVPNEFCPPEAKTLPVGVSCVIPVSSCVYTVTEADGDCGDLVVGDVICLPCDAPCEETLQCSNGTCTLILTRTDENCVFCPPNAKVLPAGFSCAVPTPACVYTVTTADGDCGDLVVGDVICLPCDAPCEETLQCSNGTCTLILTRTDENCVFCPPNAKELPDGFACEIPIPACVYELIEVGGADCGDFIVGDLICLPCDPPCDQFLACSNDTCTFVLSRTSEECVFCPPNGKVLPDGTTCSIQNGRVLNVNTGVFYDAIEVAVAAASPGDTLIVFPGAYNPPSFLAIDKSLTLRGLSAADTVVTFPNSLDNATSLRIQADNVLIDGLHFIAPTSATDGNNALLGIDYAGFPNLYENITIQNSILEGGRRSAFIRARNLSLLDNEFIHNGNRNALQIFNGEGDTNILRNTFSGSAASRAAITFEDGTGGFTGNLTIEDNTATSHSQFVLFNLAGFNGVSISVRRNNVNHESRLGSTIIFIPIDFSNTMPIVIEDNVITNPNGATATESNLAVYVDYRFGGASVPADGQIQVINNVLNVALPWGIPGEDTVFPDAPVGFSTMAPPAMSLDAFFLSGNIVTTTP